MKRVTFDTGTTMEYQDVGYYCHMSDLYINGIKTSDFYFGEGYDASPETAPDYGCGDKKWKAYTFESAKETGIVYRLGISEEDFDNICDILTEKLSVGRCDYCI